MSEEEQGHTGTTATQEEQPNPAMKLVGHVMVDFWPDVAGSPVPLPCYLYPHKKGHVALRALPHGDFQLLARNGSWELLEKGDSSIAMYFGAEEEALDYLHEKVPGFDTWPVEPEKKD